MAGILVILTSAAAASEARVTLIVPPFGGQGGLGPNVATLLNLQVWQTLRKRSPDEPARAFGHGLVQSVPGPGPADHEAAAQRALDNNPSAQLVLWGQVLHFGDGVVVQAYLTLPSYPKGRREPAQVWHELWRRGAREHVFDLDIPSRHYTFTPIVLAEDIVKRYTDIEGLQVFDKAVGGKLKGVVDHEMTALSLGGDAVQVRSGKVTGWLLLPQLSSARTEVVDFTGGVVRILRTDWQGAYELFQTVVENPHTTASLRVDALLFQALARAHQRRNGEHELDEALRRNPLSRTVAAYAMMDQAAALARHPGGDDAAAHVGRLRTLVEQYAYLFPKEDGFLAEVIALLGEYG